MNVLFADNTTQAAAATSMVLFVVIAVLAVVTIVAMWKMFEKAGVEGWKAIVPIYNIYVLLQIVGRPGWWVLLFLIPFVNFVISIIVALDTARVYGKDVVFAILGLILFSPIGYWILGFGDSTYDGSKKAGAAVATA